MKRFIITLITLSILLFASCSRLLEQEPANAITTEQIRELLESGDEEKIDLIIGGIANNLPYSIHRVLTFGGSAEARVNSPLRLQYSNSLLGYDIVCGEGVEGYGHSAYLAYISRRGAANTVHNLSYWHFGWSCVVAANKLLYYMPETLSGNKIKDYKARALTLRAFGYNFLMENYRGAYTPAGEGLMIYDRITPDEYAYKPCASAGETCDFIKKDLTEAVQLFSESKIGETEDGYTADTKDIDMAVANFVLARVALLTGDYATTVEACNSILTKYPDLIAKEYYGGKNTGTETAPEFIAETNAFIKFENNPEIIFGFTGVTSQQNLVHEWLNIFGLNAWGGSSANWGRIVNTLYDAINPNDVRKRIFLDGDATFDAYSYPTVPPVVRTIPAYSNLKYAATHVGGKTEQMDLANLDVCYMRVSEVLLMKAEAQAQDNDENGAKATLDILLSARTATGPPLTCDNYGGANSVLDMVKLQWRIEMWGENGLEYYNNKRWGNQVVRSSATSNHWDNATISVDLMTLEFPTNEIIYNPNL
jgi:hypothetical protein